MRKKLSDSLRFEILERDEFTCQYCGRHAPEVVLEVDHITPVARGGENDYDNLIAACEQCNGGKSSRQLSADPAPMRYRALYERTMRGASMHSLAWAFAELGRLPGTITLGHGRCLARIDVREARNLFDEVKVWAEYSDATQEETWARFLTRLDEVSLESARRRLRNA